MFGETCALAKRESKQYITQNTEGSFIFGWMPVPTGTKRRGVGVGVVNLGFQMAALGTFGPLAASEFKLELKALGKDGLRLLYSGAFLLFLLLGCFHHGRRPGQCWSS